MLFYFCESFNIRNFLLKVDLIATRGEFGNVGKKPTLVRLF